MGFFRLGMQTPVPKEPEVLKDFIRLLRVPINIHVRHPSLALPPWVTFLVVRRAVEDS